MFRDSSMLSEFFPTNHNRVVPCPSHLHGVLSTSLRGDLRAFFNESLLVCIKATLRWSHLRNYHLKLLRSDAQTRSHVAQLLSPSGVCWFECVELYKTKHCDLSYGFQLRRPTLLGCSLASFIFSTQRHSVRIPQVCM